MQTLWSSAQTGFSTKGLGNTSPFTSTWSSPSTRLHSGEDTPIQSCIYQCTPQLNVLQQKTLYKENVFFWTSSGSPFQFRSTSSIQFVVNTNQVHIVSSSSYSDDGQPFQLQIVGFNQLNLYIIAPVRTTMPSYTEQCCFIKTLKVSWQANKT